MKLKLRPLSELTDAERFHQHLFVWLDKGTIAFAKRDSLAGCVSSYDYVPRMKMPDGWIADEDIEVADDAANG